ncbi:hypothetical protein Aperf_G00000035680 [Anoplocephala perfoliata]
MCVIQLLFDTSMTRFAILLLFNLLTIATACKTRDSVVTSPPASKIIGGVTTITKVDMSEPMFHGALSEVLKQLDEVNKCHTFQLVRIIEATQQVVAGMMYRIKLELKPIYSDEIEEECSDTAYTSVSGNKIAEATVLVQPWKEPQHVVIFNPNSEFNKNFHRNGTLVIAPESNTWSIMSADELKAPLFQKSVQEAINKLNKDSHRCFQFELVEVLDGMKKLSSKLEYKWRMTVRKIYHYNLQECFGFCADDCSGVNIYLAKAFVSPPQSETPQIIDVRFHESFAM